MQVSEDTEKIKTALALRKPRPSSGDRVKIVIHYNVICAGFNF